MPKLTTWLEGESWWVDVDDHRVYFARSPGDTLMFNGCRADQYDDEKRREAVKYALEQIGLPPTDQPMMNTNYRYTRSSSNT